MDIFIKRLQELLDEKDMTQRELAERIGVTEVTISRYINGERKPRIDIIGKIAEVFGVSIDYLLGYSNIRNPYNNVKSNDHQSENDEDDERMSEEDLYVIEQFKKFLKQQRRMKKKD
ncbi:helix-turn-helix transcriptional regulator [Caldicoprobacter algeriensis]|uniref:helix-turn-helix domain-containing protein n=1 Tax=Caldicoprobacter algeriensis TaxID=699281 RepID=UPI00207938AB|nr:helix-turn-helix transcriptional regulator [Caldicoprobacter algeriensis]MCM8900524.1 helix-turn-helix transcriptional regulator [Caldicoprobacter algeriensis]